MARAGFSTAETEREEETESHFREKKKNLKEAQNSRTPCCGSAPCIQVQAGHTGSTAQTLGNTPIPQPRISSQREDPKST